MKKILITILSICILTSAVFSNNVNAFDDPESSSHGFQLDRDIYQKPNWNNIIVTKCYYDGVIVGRCTTYVGATRAIETTYDGKYLDHIMIESTMKGENGGYNHVGYSEYLKVYSHCPTGTELIAYSPETKSKMKSYNVGLSVNSDKSVGLSASTTVTKNSLEIDNNCNKAIRKFEIGYDYLHATWRFSWKTFDKYAYEENMQRAHFTMKTSKSKYYIGIFVKPKFQIYSSTPSFNACDRPYYVEKEDKVTFYMPY